MIYELFRGRRAALPLEHPQQRAIG
jgi:hypothetical protein